MIHCSIKATVARNFLRLKRAVHRGYTLEWPRGYTDGEKNKTDCVVEQQTSGTPVDLSQPRARTLENHLMWAHKREERCAQLSFKCVFGQAKDGTSLHVGVTP
nr:hypothetical protein [Tanacetum cinerariifolium]